MAPADIRRQVVLDEHDMAADGSLAVVSKRVIRRDRYQTHLVVVPLGLDPVPGARLRSSGPRTITSGAVRDGWPRLSPDARHVAFIRWLTDDADKAKEYLPKAQMSLKLERTTFAVHPGDKNGPTGWAVNNDAHLTAVVAVKGQVAASLGYRSVNETDVPAVLKKLPPKK